MGASSAIMKPKEMVHICRLGGMREQCEKSIMIGGYWL